MTIRCNAFDNAGPLDRKAHAAASRVAERHGLRDRARTSFFTMVTETLEEIQPAIEAAVRAEADQAARERLRSILALPEARGRRDLAERLALDTESSPEQVATILAAAPMALQHDPLARLMAGQTPGINSDDGGDFAEMAENEETEATANYILSAGRGSSTHA